MVQVRRRGGFSDRNSIKIENTEMQYHNLDARTRNALMSEITEYYKIAYDGYYGFEDEVQSFLRFVIQEVYAEFADARTVLNVDRIMNTIKNTMDYGTYDDVLTLVEAVAQYFADEERQTTIYDSFNYIFEKEYVGYRFLNGIITNITDENEIEEINQAIKSPYDAVNFHLSKSITLLSERDKPDYENSIKESISAVEALCEIITGLKGKEATLGNMLKKIEERGTIIHGALKSAFNILYGYTSDANGIRHAGDLGGPNSTFEEAKFMLVSCSAFVNYLIAVSAK